MKRLLSIPGFAPRVAAPVETRRRLSRRALLRGAGGAALALPLLEIMGKTSPTLAQFKAWVSAGRIHWFIASGSGGGASPGGNTASQITAWVEANFTATTVGGVTMYDLSGSN